MRLIVVFCVLTSLMAQHSHQPESVMMTLHSIPDAAPAEIRKIWDEMNQLVEARGGHAGLEFVPVSVLEP